MTLLLVSDRSRLLKYTTMKAVNPSDYKVVFTNRAYNAIIVESERMSPKETGGLG